MRAAVIANAMDAAPSEIRTDGVKRELSALTALGLVAKELDLRDHVGTHGAVARELRRYDIVWLRGGNVFMLRYALARSDTDTELTRLLDKDAIVYSGYSAGPCVLAPTLRGPGRSRTSSRPRCEPHSGHCVDRHPHQQRSSS